MLKDVTPVANPEVEKSVFIARAPDSSEIIRLNSNGDIYVKGNLATNDMEVVNGFRELLTLSGLI